MAVFVVNLSGDIFYEPIMLPYAVGFAICYFAAYYLVFSAYSVTVRIGVPARRNKHDKGCRAYNAVYIAVLC